MSTRTTLRPQAVIAAGNMANASITSAPTILQSLSKFSYEVSWSGSSPVGTLELQVSNSFELNPDGSVKTIGNWQSMPLDLDIVSPEATQIPISGNSGTGFIDVTAQSGYAVRLLYTKTSGTGTLTAIINGKVA